MALHTKLPIHRTASDLLGTVTRIEIQMKRGYKTSIGKRLVENCAAMLDLMPIVNATRGEQRVANLQQLIAHNVAAMYWLRVALELKAAPPSLWGDAVQLLESVGRQANGWLTKTREKAPAA